MNRSLPAFSLLLLAAAIPLRAQDAPPAISAFREGLNRNATTVFVSGRISMRVEHRAAEPDGCVLPMTFTTTFEGSPTREEVRLDLSHLTPAVRVDADDESMATSIFLDTSSGEETIVKMRHNPGTSTPVRIESSWVELAFPTEAIAREVAPQAEAAIRACGGTPRSASAEEAATERETARTGNDPETNALKAECRRMVRSLLVAPSTAVFPADDEFIALRDEARGTLTLSGTVEGQNRLGGRVTNTFICTFEKSGDSWIPTGTPLII